MTTEFNPMADCRADESVNGVCVDMGIFQGEKPVDAALDGRFDLDGSVELSKCLGEGVCGLCPTQFDWSDEGDGNAADPLISVLDLSVNVPGAGRLLHQFGDDDYGDLNG